MQKEQMALNNLANAIFVFRSAAELLHKTYSVALAIDSFLKEQMHMVTKAKY